MKRKLTMSTIVAAVLGLYIAGVWRLAGLMGLEGRNALILRLSLALLGVIVALVALLYVLRKPAPPPAPKDAVAEEAQKAFAAAEKKLAAAKVAPAGALGKLPLVMMLGPAGSTKTSSIVRSGLDVELLAGDVFREDAVVTTRGANLWFGRNTLFLEAGRDLTDDATTMALAHAPHTTRAAQGRVVERSAGAAAGGRVLQLRGPHRAERCRNRWRRGSRVARAPRPARAGIRHSAARVRLVLQSRPRARFRRIRPAFHARRGSCRGRCDVAARHARRRRKPCRAREPSFERRVGSSLFGIGLASDRRACTRDRGRAKASRVRVPSRSAQAVNGGGTVPRGALSPDGARRGTGAARLLSHGCARCGVGGRGGGSIADAGARASGGSGGDERVPTRGKRGGGALSGWRRCSQEAGVGVPRRRVPGRHSR